MVLMQAVASDRLLRALAGTRTRELLAWATGIPPGAIRQSVLCHAALVLADNIAATVGAQGEPEVRAAQARFAEHPIASEATVFNRSAVRVDRYSAAAANGLAATWCELDEGYRLAPAHAGAYILPGLLAEAEASASSTIDVLRALTLGYEIVGRFARAFPFASMSVHPHAAFGTLGAAAGVGLLREQTAEELLATVSAGATMVFAGPYNHAIEGALVRNLWTGMSAWAGLRAADFAPLGLGGMAESIYDVFVGCFGTSADPDVLTADLGQHWAIANGYHKLFACCQYAHSAVEASLKLADRLASAGRTTNDIAEIIVETHPRGLTLTEKDPPTVLSAKFSLPHAMAAVAARGTGGQSAFGRDTLDDATIVRLRQSVRLQPHTAIEAWPKDRPGRVTWHLTSGEAWTAAVENARGGADQPFSTAELLAKIEELTSDVFPSMPGVLRRLIANPAAMAAAAWRDVVAEMIKV
jgi:2-methylcitrate dehydratase PrpD